MDFVYLEFEEFENEYMFTEFDMSGEQPKTCSKLVSKLFLKKKPNPEMQIFVHFYDENDARHCVSANYGNGKLLINLGVGMKYLLENHTKLEISVCKNGLPVALPDLKEVKFLKCRQIY